MQDLILNLEINNMNFRTKCNFLSFLKFNNMKKILFFSILIGLSAASCGPLWVQGANKTFGQKKQRKKYGKKKGRAQIFELNTNKKTQYC